MSPASDLESRLAALRAAAPGLAGTGWRERVRVLGAVGSRFLDPADPLRRGAAAELPGEAGLSPAQAEGVVEGMAADWTAERLERLVRAEFSDPAVLDGWIDDPGTGAPRRLRALPLGSGVGVHVSAGSVPGVSVTAAIRGLLVGSPVLLKPGRGDRTLPRWFARGLQEAAQGDPGARPLAAALEVRYWPGGGGAPEEAAALAGAGWAVVYGGTDTVEAVRRALPPGTPLVEYGHRVSVVVVGRGADSGTAKAVAEAVALFDQRGCVSARQLFVLGDAARAEALAADVAAALSELDRTLPPGPPDAADAAAVQQLRGAAELRELAGEGVRCWTGPGVAWTVVLDPEPGLRLECLARTVHVTPLDSLDALDAVLRPVAPFLQSVGVAGFEPAELEKVAEAMVARGASRIVPVALMGFPPAWWLHDGQGPLRRLVRWAEWELR